jgi:hypothetical protein
MKEFKMPIIEGQNVSISDVFGNEPTFTDKFLVIPEQMKKVLQVIGISAEIEGQVDFQIPTTDGKSLDNLVTLEDGQRIALESQLGRSDMPHVAKLPYYMENLRHEGEVMMGVLIAEEINQEAIDYYNALNSLEFYDLYLVKAVFIKAGEGVVFTPQLISPTPTSNVLKQFKEKQSKDEYAEPNEVAKKEICDYLDNKGIVYLLKGPNKDGDYHIKTTQNGYAVGAIIRPNGRSITLGAKGNHQNEIIFENTKRYFVLKNSSSSKTVKDWIVAFEKFIANL